MCNFYYVIYNKNYEFIYNLTCCYNYIIFTSVLLYVFYKPDIKIPPPPELYTTTKTLNPKIPYIYIKQVLIQKNYTIVLSSAMERQQII